MSISTISKITDTLKEAVDKFHQRRIQKSYSIIWIDGIYFSLQPKADELLAQKGNYRGEKPKKARIFAFWWLWD